jgi:hypothetical protein
MGNIMAQIGREGWQLNMVGTSQSHRLGANIKDVVNKMKVGTYESKIWGHNSKNLVVVAWADNAIVKTMSNYHGAAVLEAEDGLMRRAKDKSGKRVMRQKAVPCPAQTKAYCQMFHLIDKGNGAEKTYNMGGQSRTHNWLPNIIFWLINMMMANAYRIYCTMVTEQASDCKCLSMKDTIKAVMFALMQRGAPMWTREASHPQPEIDLSQLHGWKLGKKVRLDSTRQAVAKEGHHQDSWTEYRVLRRMQKKQTWQHY